MSVRVLTKVFTSSTATLADRLVLLALADSAGDDGITWVGQENLAAKAHVSEQTVRRAIRNLEDCGEVETRKVQDPRSPRIRRNVYRVTLADAAPDYDRLPFDLEHPFGTTEEYERSLTTEDPDRDDRASEPLTTEDPDRSLIGSEPSVEPSKNHQAPGVVNGKRATASEVQLAFAALLAFNTAFGTRYTSKDFVSKIILRHREHPELDLEAHERIIRRVASGEQWWSDAPDPRIIYGNAKQFERCIATADLDFPPNLHALTAADYNRLIGG